ncbi:MAG: endonuclease/exonuclease/phosphatase family protein [Gemmatimonadaceae bacterium]
MNRLSGAADLGRLVVVAALVGCAARSGTPATDLRVMVYNIHAGKDASGVDNLERVAQLIRETSADVVLLQEVDKGTRRSEGVDQPAVLSRLTGLRVAFGRSLIYQGGDYGIAILSRWPITSHRTIPLPVHPPQERSESSYEPRVALEARIASPAGDLTVVNTHIDASRDDRWRRQEIVTVLAVADSARGLLLMGGDLNSTPESEIQRTVRSRGLRDAWRVCGRGGEAAGFTYPADSGVKRIDYLYFRESTSCSRAEVVATRASDHRPLLVHVTLPPAR